MSHMLQDEWRSEAAIVDTKIAAGSMGEIPSPILCRCTYSSAVTLALSRRQATHTVAAALLLATAPRVPADETGVDRLAAANQRSHDLDQRLAVAQVSAGREEVAPFV
jgi:hypothetical protein